MQGHGFNPWLELKIPRAMGQLSLGATREKPVHCNKILLLQPRPDAANATKIKINTLPQMLKAPQGVMPTTDAESPDVGKALITGIIWIRCESTHNRHSKVLKRWSIFKTVAYVRYARTKGIRNWGFTLMLLITAGSVTFQSVRKTCLLRHFCPHSHWTKAAQRLWGRLGLRRPGLQAARPVLQACFLWVLKSF